MRGVKDFVDEQVEHLKNFQLQTIYCIFINVRDLKGYCHSEDLSQICSRTPSDTFSCKISIARKPSRMLGMCIKRYGITWKDWEGPQ